VSNSGDFKLNIQLGNDACKTLCDVAELLERVANRLRLIQLENQVVNVEEGHIRDDNGNRVGGYVFNPGEWL
jgi:hypothetical protein